MSEIDWQQVRLVVFDVDGTLYDQRQLRRRMIAVLGAECLRHPRQVRVLRILAEFRRVREQMARAETSGIIDLQYRRPAERLGIEPEEVRRTVEIWMLKRPLVQLPACRFPAIDGLVQALRAAGIEVAVLSDYPVADKLVALGLAVDLEVSAVDPEVDRLKPHPRGLLRLLELAGVEPGRAVMIGDRDDRDGESARRAGVPCLIKTPGRPRSSRQFQRFEELLESFSRGAALGRTLQ